jgi:hypothetical protein
VAVLASSVEGNVSGKKFEGRQHASRQNEVFLGAKNHLLVNCSRHKIFHGSLFNMLSIKNKK